MKHSIKPILFVTLSALLGSLFFSSCRRPASMEESGTQHTPDATSSLSTPSSTATLETTASPKIGWVEVGGKHYYYGEPDVMSTGWVVIEDVPRYFRDDGSMATGRVDIEGKTHFFGSDGTEFLMVNPWNIMPEGYVPEIKAINDWQYVDAACYEPLMQMLEACRGAGLEPYVASAYRTHGDQQWLYQNKVNRLITEGHSREDAEKLAATVIAIPGTSEHELGLALDLVDNSYRNLDEAQENCPVQKWLMENSWKYGFILRYPNGKSDITGIIYEPWHYRYVGTTIASEIYASGLCLEEYIESLTTE